MMNPSNKIKIVDVIGVIKKVEKKAYEFYKDRGGEDGWDWKDWFDAEKAVQAESSIVEQDCIKSEGLFEATHKTDPAPSYIDPQK